MQSLFNFFLVHWKLKWLFCKTYTLFPKGFYPLNWSVITGITFIFGSYIIWHRLFYCICTWNKIILSVKVSVICVNWIIATAAVHFFLNQDGALYKSNQIFYDKFTVSVHVFDSSGLLFLPEFSSSQIDSCHRNGDKSWCPRKRWVSIIL